MALLPTRAAFSEALPGLWIPVSGQWTRGGGDTQPLGWPIPGLPKAIGSTRCPGPVGPQESDPRSLTKTHRRVFCSGGSLSSVGKNCGDRLTIVGPREHGRYEGVDARPELGEQETRDVRSRAGNL